MCRENLISLQKANLPDWSNVSHNKQVGCFPTNQKKGGCQMMEIINALIEIAEALIELYSMPIFAVPLILGVVVPFLIKKTKQF